MSHFLSLITFVISFCHSVAFANKIILGEKGLASAELHTEVVGKKRVYLAADVLSLHDKGRIACALKVNIQPTNNKNDIINIKKDFTLLPSEKVPFNLGLFPAELHASSSRVSGSLKCFKIKTSLNSAKKNEILNRSEKNKSLKSTSVGYTKTCCNVSPIKVVCHYEDPESIALDPDSDIAHSEYEVPVDSNLNPSDFPNCYSEAGN